MTTEERLAEAEKALMFIYGLQIKMDNREPTWHDYSTWRQELAREYLVKHGLIVSKPADCPIDTAG